MAVSNAIGSERVAKVVGYDLQKGNFQDTTPNLPQRIAIFGQANTDKQTALTNLPVEVFSANEAGNLFGFGSQIHIAMRIVRARNADIVGGIPTIVYPQVAPAGGVAQVNTITVAGAATGSAPLIIRIMGRSNFDGASLEITVSDGDTNIEVAAKIADAINNAVACPFSAVAAIGVVTLTSKWVGENTNEADIEIDTQAQPVGLTYTVAEVTPGAGDSSAEIDSSLELFQNNWNTIVVNPYPIARDGLFEAFNGVPGGSPSTGRYAPDVFKPFVCLRGSKVADTVANVTAGLNKSQVTITQCPAPYSKGWNVEAAANVASLLARQAQDFPHKDTSGLSYPDMPVPANGLIGAYSAYTGRDAIVKGGGSTVILINGRYQIEDLITTYHPDNEIPPAFRYVRSLEQDWNVRFSYFLLEQNYVVDHSIVQNDISVRVSGTVKPKQWKGVLNGMFKDLEERNIIVEQAFSRESLLVSTGDTNPDRLETFFRYKRSPFARISSTTAEAGFAFGLTA